MKLLNDIYFVLILGDLVEFKENLLLVLCLVLSVKKMLNVDVVLMEFRRVMDMLLMVLNEWSS